MSLVTNNLALKLEWNGDITASAVSSSEYYLLLSHMNQNGGSKIVAFEFFVRDISEEEAIFMNIEVNMARI